AALLEPRRDAGDPVAVGVDERQAEAVPSEPLGTRQAEPARGAGDQPDPAHPRPAFGSRAAIGLRRLGAGAETPRDKALNRVRVASIEADQRARTRSIRDSGVSDAVKTSASERSRRSWRRSISTTTSAWSL